MPGYSHVCTLGQGARSRIIQVVGVKTGQMYALKRIFRRDAHDERFIEQGENEFAVASKIDHAVIRRCHQIRRLRKWLRIQELQILMEFVDGQTLEQIRPADLAVILGIFQQVADGLDALHRAGFVHADIKPNNIMITQDGRVKIIDFGQSCPVGYVKRRIQGTPDYIAPEQVRRLPIDRRTDVYNLGATLYWVLTGTAYPTILPSRKRASGIDLVGPREARPPNEVNSEIPLSLSKLVMDCCQDRTSDRPADMRQVRSRLSVAEHMIAKNGSGPARDLSWPDAESGTGDLNPSPADRSA